MTRPATLPDESFVRVCRITDFDATNPMAVEVGGEAVALVRTECDGRTQVFAVRDECSHAAVALSEGEIDGCTLECWMHGSRFDLRTGEPTGPPASEPVPTYRVVLDGDDVYISIKES